MRRTTTLRTARVRLEMVHALINSLGMRHWKRSSEVLWFLRGTSSVSQVRFLSFFLIYWRLLAWDFSISVTLLTGGIIEARIQLPGKAHVGWAPASFCDSHENWNDNLNDKFNPTRGLWPAFWLLGNLGRATCVVISPAVYYITSITS